MGKKIVAIRYYNVWFYLHVNSEQDMVKISYLTDRIDAGEQVIMKDIYQWCRIQKIEFSTKFIYRSDLEFLLIYENKNRKIFRIKNELSGIIG